MDAETKLKLMIALHGEDVFVGAKGWLEEEEALRSEKRELMRVQRELAEAQLAALRRAEAERPVTLPFEGELDEKMVKRYDAHFKAQGLRVEWSSDVFAPDRCPDASLSDAIERFSDAFMPRHVTGEGWRYALDPPLCQGVEFWAEDKRTHEELVRFRVPLGYLERVIWDEGYFCELIREYDTAEGDSEADVELRVQSRLKQRREGRCDV